MLSLAAQARAATAQWTPFKAMDPVTDATREGVSYMDGDDGLFVVCTHQKDVRARTRFWIEVKTGAHLGRGNTRSLTYRVGGDDPTTSRWEYTPRGAMPSWPMEDRHLIERVIDRKAEKVVFGCSATTASPTT
ncbi:hypothetical protein BH09PSE2_BH09PSE2_05780 [soil metagenome]